jgi:MFS family permease
MFPTVLGFIGDRYTSLSGTAFSVAIAMALCGGMLMPYAAGVLGTHYGMRSSFVLVPAALVVQAVLLGVSGGKREGERVRPSVRGLVYPSLFPLPSSPFPLPASLFPISWDDREFSQSTVIE